MSLIEQARLACSECLGFAPSLQLSASQAGPVHAVGRALDSLASFPGEYPTRKQGTMAHFRCVKTAHSYSFAVTLHEYYM